MKAVYIPALVVYREEISFTTPIFERIIFRSFGATVCRMRSSIFAT